MASFIRQRATLIIFKIDSILDMDIYPMLLLVSGGEVVVLFVSVSVLDFWMISKKWYLREYHWVLTETTEVQVYLNVVTQFNWYNM